jgi:hypothetical protein
MNRFVLYSVISIHVGIGNAETLSLETLSSHLTAAKEAKLFDDPFG